MRDSRVVGLMASRSAAPPGPRIRQPVCSRTRRIFVDHPIGGEIGEQRVQIAEQALECEALGERNVQGIRGECAF